MLRCEERLGCTEALIVYEMMNEEMRSCIPADLVSYLKKHEGPLIMKKFIPNMVVKGGGFTEYGEKLVRRMMDFVRQGMAGE